MFLKIHQIEAGNVLKVRNTTIFLHHQITSSQTKISTRQSCPNLFSHKNSITVIASVKKELLDYLNLLTAFICFEFIHDSLN